MGDKMNYVCVSGFFASGSSAVVDLLKEMDGFYECSAEIRIIRDPYGISQMENALVSQWELINSTAAITDFLNLCKVCCRPRSTPLSRAGMGYTKTVSKDFMRYAQDYVDDLTDFKYKSEFYYHKFKKPYVKYVTDRCRWGIEHISKGRIKSANRNISDCYFALPSQEKFNNATKKFFDNIFMQQKEKGYSTIILDQAVSPNNPTVIERYFTNAKLIIVDRDPRDMFIDDLLFGVNFDKDFYSREAGLRYAIRQKALRKDITNSSNILYVRFEDLILDYDNMVLKILNFIEIPTDGHKNKGKYLKPEVSKENIGIWKSKYDECKDALDAIKETLPEYCH